MVSKLSISVGQRNERERTRKQAAKQPFYIASACESSPFYSLLAAWNKRYRTFYPQSHPTLPSFFNFDHFNYCLFLSECRNYTILDNTDRKITYGRNPRKCDRGIGPGWFRFEGLAGTRMPTSCTPVQRCSTDATGWLKGGHPTVADGQVSRWVCFHYGNACCHWKRDIFVRNCGSYYVYYLRGTPRCSLRYCTTD